MLKILVTGGAGYIGSHTVKVLGERKFEILTIDNLSHGHKEAVLYGDFIKLDISEEKELTKLIEAFRPDVVIHFAAYINVKESVIHPAKYYKNNTVNTINMLEILVKHNIKNFIFSSTAAVYGVPARVPIPENHDLNPINSYGKSKLLVEEVLKDFQLSYGLNYVSLRYFNAAGAESKYRIGESHKPETHLIPLVLKVAKKERKFIKVYGSDYDTPDGTAVRDYIHVEDLAVAHVKAVEYLMEKKESGIFNCGYGKGYSVKEIIEVAKKVTGKEIPIQFCDRREGDPPVLVADNTKIRRELDWIPKYDDIEYIIKTAWEWEKNKRF